MATSGLNSFVEVVKLHALANYEVAGWDIVVECMDDEQIGAIILRSRTGAGAIEKMRRFIEPSAEMRAEAIAEGGERDEVPAREWY